MTDISKQTIQLEKMQSIKHIEVVNRPTNKDPTG